MNLNIFLFKETMILVDLPILIVSKGKKNNDDFILQKANDYASCKT